MKKENTKRKQSKVHVKGVLSVFTRSRTQRDFERLSGASHGNAVSLMNGGGASEAEMGRLITQLAHNGETHLADELLLAHCRDHIPSGYEHRVAICKDGADPTRKRTQIRDLNLSRLIDWIVAEISRNPAVHDIVSGAYRLAHPAAEVDPPVIKSS